MKLSLRSMAAMTLAVPLVGCTSGKQEKPNIILFLIDDMGWLDTSVAFGEEVYPYNLRHDTPNIVTESRHLSYTISDKTLQSAMTCLKAILKSCRKWQWHLPHS